MATGFRCLKSFTDSRSVILSEPDGAVASGKDEHDRADSRLHAMAGDSPDQVKPQHEEQDLPTCETFSAG